MCQNVSTELYMGEESYFQGYVLSKTSLFCDLIPSISGSTDFGNVTHAVPGIHPYFYIGSEALNHTTEYTAASGESEEQRPLSLYYM